MEVNDDRILLVLRRRGAARMRLTARGHLHVDDETQRLLLQMSPATTAWMRLSGGDNLRLSRSAAATLPFLVSSRPDGSYTFLHELIRIP